MEEEGTDTGLRPETRDFTKTWPFPGFGFSTVSASVYSPPAFSTRTPFILSLFILRGCGVVLKGMP
jgi:hypothetical protein